MKKVTGILSVILVLVMLMLVFAGCSGASEKSKTEAETTKAEATTAKPTEKTTDEADNWPDRPITIVVPFSAGSNQDTASRLVAAKLEQELEASVVVLNKEGGGSIIGQTYAFQQPADGYTILAYSSVYTTNVISQNTPFKMDSFIPVAQYANEAEIIVCNADSDIKDIKDYIAKAKSEKPLVCATSGHTTADHIAAMMLVKSEGFNYEFIHTTGAADLAASVGGGHSETAICNYSSIKSLYEQGKVRILASISDQRHPALPDIPTLKESGIDLSYGKWRGFAIKKGTPDAIIEKLDAALKKVFEDASIKENFEKNGSPIIYLGTEDFTKVVMDEYERLVPIMEELDVE